MRVLYIEGVAIHGGPESCVGVREGVGEALTGVVQAGLLSREITTLGCRRRCTRRKAMSSSALCASWRGTLRGRGNLGMHGVLHAREPGGPMTARQWRRVGPAAGRGGNAEAVSL